MSHSYHPICVYRCTFVSECAPNWSLAYQRCPFSLTDLFDFFRIFLLFILFFSHSLTHSLNPDQLSVLLPNPFSLDCVVNFCILSSILKTSIFRPFRTPHSVLFSILSPFPFSFELDFIRGVKAINKYVSC